MSAGSSQRSSPCESSREECLEQQYAELQLLINMYGPDELVFQTAKDLNTGVDKINLRGVLEADDQCTFTRVAFDDGVEFVVKLMLRLPRPTPAGSKKSAQDEPAQILLEVTIQLELLYPTMPLQFFVRLPSLPTCDTAQLRHAAHDYILSEHDSSCPAPMVLDFLQWLQDNASAHLNLATHSPKHQGQQKRSAPGRLERRWVYSHHIYSDVKRRNLVAFADELGLGGFCLSGKPGVICFEGEKRNCLEYWDRIRRWQWRKLELRETVECDEKKNAELYGSFCKFGGRFQEIQMKMRDFKQYLADKQLEGAFNMLFGFGDNKESPE